jgi:S-adenosylmethionine synthetase
MGGHGIITITGELTTDAYVDVREIVKGIVGDKYGVQVNIVKQSPDIARGVDTGGAGDQGIMVGYATNETPELIPLEEKLSRSLCQFIYEKHPFDGKTQVTLEDGFIKSIVASFQNVTQKDLKDEVLAWLHLIKKPQDGIDIYCNPAGDWNIGGFEADTGLTGRKLMVDNYGPRVPIGGGCFSGKDPSKVDRSAAYMARRIAVDILRLRNAKEVFVTLSYAIGKVEPLQATMIVDGVEEPIPNTYPLTPNGIIKYLQLRVPQFEATAKFGHFGNGFPWEA